MNVLRHSKEWLFYSILTNLPYQLAPDLVQKFNRCAVNNFHAIAKKNCSSAIWLSRTGFLVTEDDKELAIVHPYESWLQQAIWISINEIKKYGDGITPITSTSLPENQQGSEH